MIPHAKLPRAPLFLEHYEINVSLKGSHLFLVRLPSDTDEASAKWHFDEMALRYPPKAGYRLELNGRYEYGQTIARHE